MLVYHATDKENFDNIIKQGFDISKVSTKSLLSGFGIHFGTLKAAQARKENGKIIKVDLDINRIAATKNPIKEEEFAFQLLRASKALSQEELPPIEDVRKAPLGIMDNYYSKYPDNYKNAVNFIISRLKKSGYNGVAYINKTEDAGSISFVVFDIDLLKRLQLSLA